MSRKKKKKKVKHHATDASAIDDSQSLVNSSSLWQQSGGSDYGTIGKEERRGKKEANFYTSPTNATQSCHLTAAHRPFDVTFSQPIAFDSRYEFIVDPTLAKLAHIGDEEGSNIHQRIRITTCVCEYIFSHMCTCGQFEHVSLRQVCNCQRETYIFVSSCFFFFFIFFSFSKYIKNFIF